MFTFHWCKPPQLAHPQTPKLSTKKCWYSIWLNKNDLMQHIKQLLKQKQNTRTHFSLCYRTHGVTCQQACIHVFPLPSLFFWEQTNCARTEIELRRLNVLLERRPQPITHLPTPHWFYFSDFLYACCNKSADAEWKCHILNSPGSPKSIQLWNLKYLGLHVCVIFRLYP